MKSETDDARLVLAPETEAALHALGWAPCTRLGSSWVG